MEKQYDENEEDLLMSIIDSEEDEVNIKSIKPLEKMDIYQMHYMEDKHWYFKYRIEVLKSLTDRFLKKESKDIEILDVGVGTGTLSKHLEQYGKCTHLEMNKEIIAFNKKMNPELKIEEGSLPWNIPFLEHKKFDYIILFNVLEYLEKDEWTIKVLYKMLKKDGKIIISTLSSESMLGATEQLYGIKRNYNIKKIEEMFFKVNLNINFCTFFENTSFSKKISNSADKLLKEDEIFYNIIPKDNDLNYETLKQNEFKKVTKRKLKSGNQLFFVLDIMTPEEKISYLKRLEKENETKMVDKIINKIVDLRNQKEELTAEEMKEDLEEIKKDIKKSQ